MPASVGDSVGFLVLIFIYRAIAYLDTSAKRVAISEPLFCQYSLSAVEEDVLCGNG